MSESKEQEFQKWIESLAKEIPKDDPRLQKLAINTFRELWPYINDKISEHVLETYGIRLSIAYLTTLLSRDIWRAIAVGTHCSDQINFEFPAKRFSHFDWRRRSTLLITSVFVDKVDRAKQSDSGKLQEELKVQYSLLQKVRNLIVSEWKKYQNEIYELKVLFQTLLHVKDKFRYARVNFVLKKRGDFKKGSLRVVFDNAGYNLKFWIYLGVRYCRWVPVSATGRPATIVPFDGKLQSEIVRGVREQCEENLGMSELVCNMVTDAVRNFLAVHVQPFIQWTLAARRDLALHRNEGPVVYASHPTLTYNYLGYLEAARQLGIPSVEFAHGGRFTRFKETLSEYIEHRTDFFLSFGKHCGTLQRISFENSALVLPEKTGRPGYWYKSHFFKRRKRHPERFRNILFGSYYLADGDECETNFLDAQLIKREIEIIRWFADRSEYKLTLKIRPGGDNSLIDLLSGDDLSRIVVNNTGAKSSPGYLQKFDAVVFCHYSTMLLEAVSTGVYTIYLPSANEADMLTDDFKRYVKDSPEEIARLEDPEAIVDCFNWCAGKTIHEQVFSEMYMRPIGKNLEESVISDLHEDLIRFNRQHLNGDIKDVA